MASPQPDKFTKISTELLEAFCLLQLSGSEWSFIHALIRKTYGYGKKEDWVTNTQIMQLTGLCKERVSEAKKSLLAKKIVTEKRNKISIQKDYELWTELRKNVTKVTEKRNSELRKNVTTIDNIIEDNISEQSSANNQENMTSFKNLRKYKEDGHWDEPAIDADTGEFEEIEIDKEAEAEKERKQKVRHNIKLVFASLKFPQRDPKTINWHVKFYIDLLDRGWSHEQIVSELINITQTDIWKEKMQNGEYPGINTVEFNLRNKDPKKYVIA